MSAHSNTRLTLQHINSYPAVEDYYSSIGERSGHDTCDKILEQTELLRKRLEFQRKNIERLKTLSKKIDDQLNQLSSPTNFVEPSPPPHSTFSQMSKKQPITERPQQPLVYEQQPFRSQQNEPQVAPFSDNFSPPQDPILSNNVSVVSPPSEHPSRAPNHTNPPKKVVTSSPIEKYPSSPPPNSRSFHDQPRDSNPQPQQQTTVEKNIKEVPRSTVEKKSPSIEPPVITNASNKGVLPETFKLTLNKKPSKKGRPKSRDDDKRDTK
ncbi:hypothetical protein QTN25_001796 [Entamoeba marina]